MRAVAILFYSVALATLVASSRASEPDFGRLFGECDGTFVLFDASRDEWTRYRAQLGTQRFPPCSTFKIANSLIAIETGIAGDSEFRIGWDGVKHPVVDWNRDHTLRTAFRASCVWYYQEIARRVGASKMKDWVRQLSYGNCDTSGAVDQFWLGTPLAISAEEQVRFIRRMSCGELPVSKKALDTVLDIMTISTGKDYVYRGKTGTAGDPAANRATHGWWVGSLRVGIRDYYFATLILGGSNPSGRNARRIAEAILSDLRLLPLELR